MESLSSGTAIAGAAFVGIAFGSLLAALIIMLPGHETARKASWATFLFWGALVMAVVGFMLLWGVWSGKVP